MIRVMVVDDEPLAQEELVRLISEDKDFQIISQAGNGAEALQQMKKLPVDVVFLDIEMPRLNGLEVTSRLTEWENPPRVVFATAYHQYAIEAFEANAIDYLLKPYEPSRLKKTLERIKELFKTEKPSRERLISLEDDLIRKGVLKKIVGHKRNAKDRIVLDPTEVYYFFAHLAEVLAYTANGELIVNSTLKELLANLDPAHFAQTHKSYMVNLGQIEKVSPLFSGNFEITLKHPSLPKIPLSRRYAKGIKSRLGSW
ncbi:MAG: response regulator [Candidatus Omnitrophica bacterium]|nr:response regulator [Candidatus Omnitrophota bacterium]